MNPNERTWVGDFLTYFLAPWLGSTLSFLVLIWWRDPAGFVVNWPAGVVASGVFGFAAFLGFAHYRRKIFAGPWRHFI